MRIDASQHQMINPAALQTREVAGEREPDGDADDMKVRSARMQPAALQQPQQGMAQLSSKALPSGMGAKVDLFA